MQDGTQHFTLRLIKEGLHCLWSARSLLETRDAFLLKGMDRVAHGLRGTPQVLGNDFRTLLATGG